MDRDVGDPYLGLLDAGGLHTVVEHDVTERACGCHTRGTGGDCLSRTFVIDLRADRLFNSHPCPAGTTTHALRAAARHLDDFDALDRGDDVARRQIHVVVPAEVARVVIRDPLLK